VRTGLVDHERQASSKAWVRSKVVRITLQIEIFVGSDEFSWGSDMVERVSILK